MTTSITDTAETTVLVAAEPVKLSSVKEVLAYLISEYPLCFAADENIKPLKVGIFQDLAQHLNESSPLSKTQLRQALRVYTSSWRYLDATKEGVSRIDLNGQAGEVIDQQQAEHAAKLLAESKQKAAEKRKARMQEQRAKQQAEKANDVHLQKNKLNKTPAKPSKAGKFVKPVPAAAVKPSQPAIEQSLITHDPLQLSVGNQVLVKLGLSPMPATVTEINLPDVTVQLDSGMIIKTRQDSLYKA